MAVNYSFEFREMDDGYPFSIPEKKSYKDVDAETAAIVQQIENYISNGDYPSAKQLIEENSEALEGTYIDSTDINRIIEDIRNTQIYARTRQQEIFFDSEEPGYVVMGDVWISGGELIDE